MTTAPQQISNLSPVSQVTIQASLETESELQGFKRTESGVSNWSIRKMPRSWRLELNIDPKHAIRSGARISRQKALRIHFALVRQIRGLSEGHFSLLSIPANLFRSKGPLSVSFRDCELNPILTGETAIEKRLFNLALMQTTCRYLSGDENWPEIECPTTADAYCDSWSEQLWIEDSHLLRLAYFDFVLPLKAKEFSLVREVGL